MSVQLEEQKFEMERLRRELEEKMAEVMRIKGTLHSSETVSAIRRRSDLDDSSKFTVLLH